MSSVTGQDNVIRMLLAVKDGARVKLLETMNTVATDMQRYVQAEKLSGNPIKRVPSTSCATRCTKPRRPRSARFAPRWRS
jgi:hypothetical protein